MSKELCSTRSFCDLRPEANVQQEGAHSDDKLQIKSSLELADWTMGISQALS